MTASRY